MERLTSKKEANAQRKAYERRLKQGYPRNIPEERFLKLAAYEDAEESGLLARLPCKVGSTVYWIPDLHDKWGQEMWETKVKEQGRILTDIVAGFRFYGEHEIRLVLPNLGIEPIYPHEHLFFTREEAEAALKGAKTDG